MASPEHLAQEAGAARVHGRSRRASSSRASPSREAILEAARRLYAASDYAGVTMRAVAKEVGCRSPSLYHYFESKDQIFRALVDVGLRLFQEFLPTSPSPDPLGRLWWRFWRYYEFSKAHPEYFRLLFVERSSPVGDETLHARVMSGAETRALIETCKEEGLMPPMTPAAEAGLILVCAIHGVAVIGLRSLTAPVDRDALAATVLRLALDGVCIGLLQPRELLNAGIDGSTSGSAIGVEPGTAGGEDSLRDDSSIPDPVGERQ